MNIFKQLNDLYKDVAGASRLTADAHSFLRLSVDFLLFRVMKVVSVPLTNRIRRIHLRGGIQLFYRLNRADIFTIHEVFIDEIYRLPDGLTPKTIVDLGANIGLTSLWLATQYQSAYVIAVEPSASNARLTRLNLTQNNIPGVVLEAAAGAEDGEVIFDAGPGSTNGRVVDFTQKSSQAPGQVQVKMLSMASILHHLPAGQKVDLLKVDIEGGEQQLLSSDITWLNRVQALVAEFHPSLVDYRKLIQILEENKFKLVQHQKVNENALDILQRY